ncbi:hypothetical protein IV460_11215 [Enterococcus casseliflavus]|uniref:hypothetical protein n=1 Tax=Enterococcus casseliflavus TaxID=37734 RepID=UPI000E497D8B|nr:hypothetical protein [Enterococcus casseliflavus]MCD5191624.1 hypothetical protein [Enterococcus casseliflavus]MDT2973397.1 hypothetical protein [Enterococcus casseliflavus]MDY2550505.1 hypothetical protein [Enterococcus casseliflavus]RHH55509.1 hypothetical protein DW201_09190 [Enterococcus casseliflavus]
MSQTIEINTTARGGEILSEEIKLITVLEKNPETAPVGTYLQLLAWSESRNLKQEDLALACQIFLMINDKRSN